MRRSVNEIHTICPLTSEQKEVLYDFVHIHKPPFPRHISQLLLPKDKSHHILSFAEKDGTLGEYFYNVLWEIIVNGRNTVKFPAHELAVLVKYAHSNEQEAEIYNILDKYALSVNNKPIEAFYNLLYIRFINKIGRHKINKELLEEYLIPRKIGSISLRLKHYMDLGLIYVVEHNGQLYAHITHRAQAVLRRSQSSVYIYPFEYYVKWNLT